jgi:hypothetical protein
MSNAKGGAAMSESHHEYMMRTSQSYREFIEERNRELSASIPVLECGQRPKDMWRIRDLESRLSKLEAAADAVIKHYVEIQTGTTVNAIIQGHCLRRSIDTLAEARKCEK